MRSVLVFILLVEFSLFSYGSFINLTYTEVENVINKDRAIIGDAEFLNASFSASGSGTLRRWYGLQDIPNDNDDVEFAYNYDGDEKNDPFEQKIGGVANPEVHLSDLYIVEYNGKTYAEFVLDSNENDKLLSMDVFKLYVNTDPVASPYITVRSGIHHLGDLVYDMDANGDTSILIEEPGSGSGSTDLTVLVSTDVFQGYSSDSKLYLFSEFGNQGVLNDTLNSGSLNFGVNDGFEEWGFRTGGSGISVVPEASTVFSGSVLLLCLGFIAFFRRQKQ